MIALLRRLLGRAKPGFLDAGPSDAGAIAALHAAVFHRGWSEDEIERLIVDGAVMTHRAMLSGKLAGFVMSRRAADEAEILSVAVSNACRGRGLARGLLHLHLGRLAGNGVRAVFLEVDETNMPAIRLYRRAGFREIGRRPDYYATPDAKPAAALVLRRDLG